MKRLLALFLLVAGVAHASDGGDCTASIVYQGKTDWDCQLLCDGKGTVDPLTCGPIFVKNQQAKVNKLMVQTTGGCNYNDIVVGELATSTTSGVAIKAFTTIDEDLVAVTGLTGVTEVVVPWALGPWMYVSSGSLTNCSTSTFSIWLLQQRGQ